MNIVKGYQNGIAQKKINDLEIEIKRMLGDETLMGIGGVKPFFESIGNGLMTPVHIIGGIFGREPEELASIKIPDALKGTELETSINEYLEMNSEAVHAHKEAASAQITSFLSFNVSGFNEASQQKLVAKNLEQKADNVALPVSEKSGGNPLAGVIKVGMATAAVSGAQLFEQTTGLDAALATELAEKATGATLSSELSATLLPPLPVPNLTQDKDIEQGVAKV